MLRLELTLTLCAKGTTLYYAINISQIVGSKYHKKNAEGDTRTAGGKIALLHAHHLENIKFLSEGRLLALWIKNIH